MEYFETSDIELWIFLNYAFFKHVPTICNIISIYVSNYNLTSFRKWWKFRCFFVKGAVSHYYHLPGTNSQATGWFEE